MFHFWLFSFNEIEIYYTFMKVVPTFEANYPTILKIKMFWEGKQKAGIWCEPNLQYFSKGILKRHFWNNFRNMHFRYVVSASTDVLQWVSFGLHICPVSCLSYVISHTDRWCPDSSGFSKVTWQLVPRLFEGPGAACAPEKIGTCELCIFENFAILNVELYF